MSNSPLSRPNAFRAEPARLPLTPAQMEIWLEAQKGDRASCRYNESVTLHFRGPFNLAAMCAAIQRLTRRHDALHAVFSPHGDYQEIRPETDVEIPFEDLGATDASQRVERITALQLHEGQIPFDLANGPLGRARVVRIGDQEHVVLLTFHHIVCDGWSLSVLIRELGELYSAADRGTAPSLAAPARFTDYLYCQTTATHAAESARCEAHWLERLAGQLPVLELPTDRLRPVVKQYRGSCIMRPLPVALAVGLKQFGARHNVNLFATLLAAFEVLLHRLSGQESFLIGIAVPGQATARDETLVGHCTNLLPLRSEIHGGMKFTDVLERTHREVLDICDHQHCTLGTLVRKLNLARDPSRAPLVPITFSLDRDPGRLDFPGLNVELFPNPKSFLNLDLSLNIRDTGNDLQLACDFDTDLFHAETIQRWLRHYQTLLEAIVAESTLSRERSEETFATAMCGEASTVHAELPRKLSGCAPCSELPLLTSAERQQLLVDWNKTKAVYPAKTIPELFEEQAAARPGTVAVVFGHRELTYGELNAQANQLAHQLVELGVGPDCLVGLCAERSLELIVALLAILKAGGAYLPLETSSPIERLRSVLHDAQPAVILVQSRSQKDTIEAALTSMAEQGPAPRFVWLERDGRLLARKNTTNSRRAATPENLAYVCFTSGSTGGPKGVAVSHRAVVRLVRNTNYISLSPRDVFLQFAPVSFDASTFEIWGALLNGARLIVFPPLLLSLAELGGAIRKHQVSVLWLTAGLFHQMVEQQLDNLKGVRKILAGGEVLSVAHVRKALERLGEGRLINAYGPTENTTFTCCHPISQASVEGRSIPIGRPIANTECFILDRNLRPVPIGVAGELFTGGDGLARGYLNQPALTAEKFIPNPFQPEKLLYRTGDLARFLPDGNIEFLGRTDLLVKIRGFRIELGEIERALEEHRGVSKAVVIAREDVPGEKRLVAYFTSRRHSAPTAVELRSFLAEKLPDYMAPSVFMRLHSLPLTDNGKVDRRALPAPDGQRPGLGTDYVPPRDPVQTQLTAIWEGLLGIEPIGIRDRFFDLGGHSLMAVRLFAQIEKLFGKRIPFTALFQAPTIEQLADLIRAKDVTPARSLLVAIQENGSKPPLFLVHGAGGGMLWGYTNLALHLGTDQPVYGIDSRARHGGEEFRQLEDMARHYVTELRALQPEGPYHLGGYCFGGNIAWEMARQLRDQDQAVGLLALFEACPINGGHERVRWWRPRFALDFALNLGYWMGYLAGLSAQARGNLIRRRLRSAFRNFTWRTQNSTGGQPPLDLDSVVDVSQIPESERTLWLAHLRVIEGHVSAPYPGHVHLFRTRRQPLWCSFDPAYGWGELAGGGVTLRIIPGSHESIFIEPYVRRTAEELRRALEDAWAVHLTAENQPSL